MGPGTYIPLSKAHLDVAREFALQGRYDEAQREVTEAQDLIYEAADQPLARGWLWRMLYLLGDIFLFKGDKTNAAYYYQSAVALNPDFVPAQALVDYLNDAGSPSTPGETSSNQPVPQVSGQSESVAPATPQSMSAQFKKEVAPSISSTAIQIVGSGLTLIAEILEIAELAPVATAITLWGLIAQLHGN
jgi:tetratricopeptide (TPR) repeat protein